MNVDGCWRGDEEVIGVMHAESRCACVLGMHCSTGSIPVHPRPVAPVEGVFFECAE